jgi:hypothetical protein
MHLIQGNDREELEELVRQLRAHGPGGGSANLSSAMSKFGAFSTHDLAVKLAQRLLSMEVQVMGSGGPGG